MVKMYPKKRGEILIDRAEDHIVSNTKMKELVPNYSPKYNLTSGVNETLTYYQNNNKVLGVDYKFDGQIDRLIHSMGGVI